MVSRYRYRIVQGSATCTRKVPVYWLVSPDNAFLERKPRRRGVQCGEKVGTAGRENNASCRRARTASREHQDSIMLPKKGKESI